MSICFCAADEGLDGVAEGNAVYLGDESSDGPRGNDDSESNDSFVVDDGYESLESDYKEELREKAAKKVRRWKLLYILNACVIARCGLGF